MKYPFAKSLFFLDTESIENTVYSNGEKRDDLTSPFMSNDNVERHKRFTEDMVEELTSRKGILTILLHPFILYVTSHMSLLKYAL